jgi:hypothetical protein
MSKERARRRAEREREAAVKAAARAAERERAERRAARRRALARRLPFLSPGPGGPSGRPGGVLAHRARQQTTFLVCLLVALNALLWFARDDWAIRLAGVVVSLLAAPVLYTLLFRRP